MKIILLFWVLFLISCSQEVEQGIFLSAVKIKDKENAEQWAERGKPYFFIFDLKSKQYKLLPLEKNGGHEVIAQGRYNEALLFCQWEDLAWKFDLVKQEVKQHIHALKDHVFYGHALYSSDGESVLVVENNYRSKEGKVVIRDRESLRPKGELNTYGFHPHEIAYSHDYSKLFIANSGFPTIGKRFSNNRYLADHNKSSLNIIALDSDKLLARHIISHNYEVGHIAVSDQDDVVLALSLFDLTKNTTKLAIAFWDHQQHKLIYVDQSSVHDKQLRMKLQKVTLTVELLNGDHHLACATHPNTNLVSIWNYSTHKLLKTFSFQHPMGCSPTLNNKSFIVSTAHGRLVEITTDLKQHNLFNNPKYYFMQHGLVVSHQD